MPCAASILSFVLLLCVSVFQAGMLSPGAYARTLDQHQANPQADSPMRPYGRQTASTVRSLPGAGKTASIVWLIGWPVSKLAIQCSHRRQSISTHPLSCAAWPGRRAAATYGNCTKPCTASNTGVVLLLLLSFSAWKAGVLPAGCIGSQPLTLAEDAATPPPVKNYLKAFAAISESQDPLQVRCAVMLGVVVLLVRGVR